MLFSAISLSHESCGSPFPFSALNALNANQSLLITSFCCPEGEIITQHLLHPTSVPPPKKKSFGIDFRCPWTRCFALVRVAGLVSETVSLMRLGSPELRKTDKKRGFFQQIDDIQESKKSVSTWKSMEIVAGCT